MSNGSSGKCPECEADTTTRNDGTENCTRCSWWAPRATPAVENVMPHRCYGCGQRFPTLWALSGHQTKPCQPAPPSAQEVKDCEAAGYVHDWQFIAEEIGDHEVVNGTCTYSWKECRVCHKTAEVEPGDLSDE